MKREIKKHLYDIKTSIDSIFEYLGKEVDFKAYQKNKLLRRGIEREIENSRKIIDTRNWVIHGYDKVDDIVIWGIITDDLPKLKLEINNLLSKE
jgi:uncharacterized protein with HEPN domain